MSDLDSLISKWESTAISFKEAEVFISLLVDEAKRTKPVPPPNKIGATHWAILPDDSFVFYKLGESLLIWSGSRWYKPSMVPYTLYSFDDYDE